MKNIRTGKMEQKQTEKISFNIYETKENKKKKKQKNTHKNYIRSMC